MKRVPFLLAIFFLMSCASSPKFISPNFDYNAIASGGLAILPAGGAGDQSLRRSAGESLEEKLRQRYKGLKIVGIESAAEALIKSELMDEYTSVLGSYQLTGSFDPANLQGIGKVLNCRYLALPFVHSYEKEKEKGDYKHIVVLELQVWDVNTEKMQFQDVETGESSPSGWMFGLFGSSPEKAAKDAAGKIADKFPKL